MARIVAAALLLGAACAAGDASPQIFARDVISTKDWESHPAISPDGSTLLFVKSDAQFGGWKILESHRGGSKWSAPGPASFSGKYLDADPFFTADGRTLYFISNRPAADKNGDDLDIWMIERDANGWGEARRLPAPVNSPASEWFPRVQANGDIYFGSDRRGGEGQTDIYVACKDDAGWHVENLGAPISTKGDEYEFEISPDGGWAVLMATRDGGFGNGDLYLSRRKDDRWSEPINLGATVNSPNLEVGPMVSDDGATFYWSSARDLSRLGDIYALPARDLLNLAPSAAEPD